MEQNKTATLIIGYTEKLAALNAKLEPIEANLPIHLREYIGTHHDKIDVTKLSPVASERYTRYLTAIKARKELQRRLASLRKTEREIGKLLIEPMKPQRKIPHKNEAEKRDETLVGCLTMLPFVLDERFLIIDLPKEMNQEIAWKCDKSTAAQLALVNSVMYKFVGNSPIWKTLCEKIETKPTPKPNETWRHCYAVHCAEQKLITPFCYACKNGGKTKKNDWGIKLCVSCRSELMITIRIASKTFKMSKQELEALCPWDKNGKASMLCQRQELYKTVIKTKGWEYVENLSMAKKRKRTDNQGDKPKKKTGNGKETVETKQ